MSSKSNFLIVVSTQAVVWGLMIGYAAFLWRRFKAVRAAWRQFAQNRGYLAPGEKRVDPLTISGSRQGLSFKIDIEDRRSGKNTARFTRCRVDLSRELPKGLVISKEGVFSGLGKVLGVQDIQTDDADFDKEAIVKGESPAEVLQYLRDPGVREAALSIVRGGWGSRIEKNQIRLYVNGLVNSDEKLEQLLARAIEAASVLNRS